jgi:predicted benzoate:H+ symporter BenE
MAAVLLLVGTAGLAVPLATSEGLGFSSRQTNAWIVALYGISGVLCIAFALAYRQPVLFGFSTPLLVFFATLAGNIDYADLTGATLVGGAAVLVLAALGLTDRVARIVPRPVVFGVLAGSTLPFVVGVFDALGDERLLVGGAIGAYVLSRRLLSPRFPAILPALVVGLILAVVSDRFGDLPTGWTGPALDGARPTFSPAAIVTVVPIFVAMVTLVGNGPGITYMRSQGYAPPARMIGVASGAAAMSGRSSGLPRSACCRSSAR